MAKNKPFIFPRYTGSLAAHACPPHPHAFLPQDNYLNNYMSCNYLPKSNFMKRNYQSQDDVVIWLINVELGISVKNYPLISYKKARNKMPVGGNTREIGVSSYL